MNAQDEVVVVFGGSSGIGEAVARRVLARGSRVVIVGRDADRLAAVSGRLGGPVRTTVVDASDRDAVHAFFASQTLAVDHLVLSFSTRRRCGRGTGHRHPAAGQRLLQQARGLTKVL